MDTFNIKEFIRKRNSLAPYVASPKCSWKDHIEYLHRDQDGKRLKCPPHQIEIFKFIEDTFAAGHDRCAIEAAWGHGKTQSIGLFYPIRMIGMNPRIRIPLISASESTAILRVGANKNTITNNPDFKRVFPHVKPGDKWGESSFRVAGAQAGATDYTMRAGGVNSSQMGGRGDLIIFDDICDLNNSMTEDMRQKTIAKVRMQWMSRLAPNGRIIAIGTPWHREDAIRVITKQWQRLKICVSEDVMCLEMYVNDKMVKQLPLWDDVWPRKRLLAEQKENFKTFNIGFRLIPASDEDATFKHIEKAIRYNTDPMDYEYVGVWGGFDISTKSRPGTCGQLTGITPTGQRVLIENIYLDDPAKIKDVLWQWREAWGGKLHYVNVENNAIQDALVDILKGHHILPIRGFLTHKNKSDPYLGLPVLDISFENDSLIIPIPHAKDYECNCPRCKMVRAFRLHPFGAETDSVMAVWFSHQASMDYGRQVMA